MELESGMKWMKRVALEPAPLQLGSGGATDYYDGSRLFTWVADLSGLPIDQVMDVSRRHATKPHRSARHGTAGRGGRRGRRVGSRRALQGKVARLAGRIMAISP